VATGRLAGGAGGGGQSDCSSGAGVTASHGARRACGAAAAVRGSASVVAGAALLSLTTVVPLLSGNQMLAQSLEVAERLNVYEQHRGAHVWERVAQSGAAAMGPSAGKQVAVLHAYGLLLGACSQPGVLHVWPRLHVFCSLYLALNVPLYLSVSYAAFSPVIVCQSMTWACIYAGACGRCRHGGRSRAS
jgi:hypothetical protein